MSNIRTWIIRSANLAALAALTTIGAKAARAATFVEGYHAANNGADGLAYFNDTAPNPAYRSYRIEARGLINPVLIVQSQAFNMPSGPSATESHQFQFTLPLVDANPTSWECLMQIKTRAFSGLNATGTQLFASAYLIVDHPSTDMSAPAFNPVPTLPGAAIIKVIDQRATAAEVMYDYEIYRQMNPGALTLQAQTTHGILGAFPTTAVHGLVQRNVNVNLITGNQSWFVRSRREFLDSDGLSLGRYDIGHPSPSTNLVIAIPTPTPTPVPEPPNNAVSGWELYD